MDAVKPETDLLARLIAAAEMRARVIASNLANQNVPGYVRQVVRFEDLLRAEMGRANGNPERVVPQVVEDLTTPGRPDGNNVSLELELNAMRENKVLQETYLTILQGQFRMLETAVTAGN